MGKSLIDFYSLNKMDFKYGLFFALLIFPEMCFASNLKEIEVVTASCENCGMTFLGELSVKVCGQGQAPTICCVVANIDNDDDNFEEGAIDIFTGNDLKECNNFDLGNLLVLINLVLLFTMLDQMVGLLTLCLQSQMMAKN